MINVLRHDIFSLFFDPEYTFPATFGLSLFCIGSMSFLIPLLCLSTKGRKVQDTPDKKSEITVQSDEDRRMKTGHSISSAFIFSFISTLYFLLHTRPSYSFLFHEYYSLLRPIFVAARSKAWVCGRSLPGIVGSNPARSMNVCIL